MRSHPRNWNKRPWITTGTLLILLLALLFMIPVPYYVIQPGSALDVQPMIQVKGMDFREQGSFMMTTVSLREGNVIGYLAARLDPDLELVPKEQILGRGENPEQYHHRQEEIMHQSQDNAIIAAYRQAGRPVEEKMHGVQVLRILKNMPAEKVLKEGDVIKEADGRPVRSAEELMGYLEKKKPGDRVLLTLRREKRTLEKGLELGVLEPGERGETRAGMGIVPVTIRQVKTSPEVHINADEIGGPSAGLMFSLEILNQLTPQDLTRGYRVAGTGTITEEGVVGPIGGVEHKVVAADREEADIFFVPADEGTVDSNEEKAMETARRIGTDMKIVPVRSLKEAVGYMKRLPAKKEGAEQAGH